MRVFFSSAGAVRGQSIIYSDLGPASPSYSYSGSTGASDTLIPATLIGTGDAANPTWQLTSITTGVYLPTNNLPFTEQIAFKIYGNMNTASSGVVNSNLLGVLSANVPLSGLGAKFITLTVPPGINFPNAVNPTTIGVQQEEFYNGSTTLDNNIRSLFVNAGPTSDRLSRFITDPPRTRQSTLSQMLPIRSHLPLHISSTFLSPQPRFLNL